MARKLFGIPAYNDSSNRRIRLLVARNPKRGASRLRYDQYKDGMTVGEYIKACDVLGIPNYAKHDIVWDSDPKRKFIELYD
jgi:hypothetical protein